MDCKALKEFATQMGPSKAVLSWCLGMATFHTLALLFHVLDVTGIAKKWRTTSAKGLPTYQQMLPLVLSNQVLVLLPCMLLTQAAGLTFTSAANKQVSLPMEATGFFVMALGHDILFYIGHRFLLHSKWGYRALGHNVHHATKAHCALSSMYMAPLDFVFEIVIPYLVPLAIVSQFSLHYVGVLSLPLGCVGGLLEHSGYNFAPHVKLLDTTAHKLHHEQLRCSFSDGVGSTNFMDEVFGSSCIAFIPKAVEIVRAAKSVTSRETKA